eukprot:Seg1146.3 transcript_id=Seg1146.3/GoldUCD/mRNA.D3Y31 product="BTB/POZ domain-containing protein 2" protein_id=Seg1146.3/GoldUCD/D3Y31
MADATVDIGVKMDKAHEDWQALKSNWKGRMSHLYNNEIMSDITFKVQDERFKAHKLVMASASSVFYAMFYGPVAEQRLEIEIVDCANSEDFTEFLKFVYTEELSLTWDNVFAVAYLAKKYYIPSLTDECCRFLLKSLTMENALSVLNLSVAADQQEMAKECLRQIKVRIRELSRTPEFLELNRDALKAILELDVLDMVEFDVFRAVDKWCKHQLEKKEQDVTQEAKREILGEVVNLVRFPTISVQRLTNYCYPSGLITKDQFVDLVSFLMSKDPDKNNKINKEQIPYEISRRERSNYAVLMNSQGPQLKYQNLFPNENGLFCSCFKVNEKVWLKGLTIPSKQPPDVVTIKGGDGTCRRPKFSIKVADSGAQVCIFKTPIELLPNVEYNALNKVKRQLVSSNGYSVTYAPHEKPSWDGAEEYNYGSFTCKFIQPTLCKCWGLTWKNLPQLIFSQKDNVQIPVDEHHLLFERALK